MRQPEPVEDRIRRLEAWDERQYMLNENYEVYEKQGEPVGAAALHYHNFYEIIYVMEGEFASLAEDKIHPLHRGDFLLLRKSRMSPGGSSSGSRTVCWNGWEKETPTCPPAFMERAPGSVIFPGIMRRCSGDSC